MRHKREIRCCQVVAASILPISLWSPCVGGPGGILEAPLAYMLREQPPVLSKLSLLHISPLSARYHFEVLRGRPRGPSNIGSSFRWVLRGRTQTGRRSCCCVPASARTAVEILNQCWTDTGRASVRRLLSARETPRRLAKRSRRPSNIRFKVSMGAGVETDPEH